MMQKPHWQLKQTANYLLHRPPMSPVRFVIFGRGRSGSTALVSLLDAVKGMCCDGEILSRPVFLPQTYVQSRCAHSHADVYGCKILSYHIRDVQPLLQRRRFLQQLHHNGFKVIYLRRLNLFNHALSNIKARISGFYQKKTDRPTARKVITVQPEKVLDWMQRSEQLANYELDLLQGVNAMSLTYEDHLMQREQHQTTVNQICDFLGVSPSPVTSAYRKLSSGRWQDTIANHQELTEFLSKTPYVHYLETP